VLFKYLRAQCTFLDLHALSVTQSAGLYTEVLLISKAMRLIRIFVADLSNGDSLKSFSVFNRDGRNVLFVSIRRDDLPTNIANSC